MKIMVPCLITVYDRIDHLKNCINSLLLNSGAKYTPLYVAVDYPYEFSNKAFQDYYDILSYLKLLKGFESVNVIKRNWNYGSYANIQFAIRKLFFRYDKVIFTEDDNVFSPYFLEYMNDSLYAYSDEENVFSVCGYYYPVKILNPNKSDVVLRKAYSAWGVGFWREKYKSVDFNCKDFYDLFVDPSKLLKLNRAFGDHVFINMIKSRIYGTVYSDSAINYHQFKHSMYSLFPKYTLVLNKGNDGSGENCILNHDVQLQKLDLMTDKLDVKFYSCENIYDINMRRLYFEKSITKKMLYYLYYILSRKFV